MRREDMVADIILVVGICLLVIFLLVAAPAKAADTYGPYRAQVYEVIDGDTIKVDVELWPGLTQRVNIRVKGINTPETRAGDECEREAGKNAKAFVQGQIMRASEVVLTEIVHDKYAGRALARVWLDGFELAKTLIATGHARPYDGGKRGPWCDGGR